VSVDLTDAERAYLIGLYGRAGSEMVARAVVGEESAIGVLVNDLLNGDGPWAEERKP
jgi:hypothetical protein